MEEDAGKLIHDEWEDCSLVDYNRSGVPLIEIVSEPDMRSAEEVIAYLEKLRMMIQYLGASDCKLQEGSMRADVNLSVREVGSEKFGTRTEMKNLNSFKAIARAIEGERERQIELIEEGRAVVQETRRWDDNKDASFAMRSKENAQDYRYFPEPDLPPIQAVPMTDGTPAACMQKNAKEFLAGNTPGVMAQYAPGLFSTEQKRNSRQPAPDDPEAVKELVRLREEEPYG